MFYRRKIILSLLQVFEGRLEKINLQKLLFLLCEEQYKPAYDFIPYRFGSYSYSAKADLNAMVRKELVTENETGYSKVDQINYLSLLIEDDKKLVNKIYKLYRNCNGDDLMLHTYTRYPYYAIHSQTAIRLLTKAQLKQVDAERPSSNITALYTIGYEGISLEAYLNKLIKHDIKVLVDVRNNPISQKFGFSKNS